MPSPTPSPNAVSDLNPPSRIPSRDFNDPLLLGRSFSNNQLVVLYDQRFGVAVLFLSGEGGLLWFPPFLPSDSPFVLRLFCLT